MGAFWAYFLDFFGLSNPPTTRRGAGARAAGGE
jgi:hypothetical protein